ncbi:bifunctional 5,10-methylenetetrahydrofolate dehydrogenase/5,10-methenyltetrahydrofolate cyclohydrolase [Clostridium sp. DL1XJH146]
MGRILSGKDLSNKLRDELKINVQKLNNEGQQITLANILVGDDGGSKSYFNAQNKACEKVGIKTRNIILNENIQEELLIEIIDTLNNDDMVNGIMLQLPLPDHLNENKITGNICYTKDVDCLSTNSIGRFYKDEKSFLPCTPKGIISLLKENNIEIKGMNAVIVGRSNIVGKPMANLLLKENATVTICHSKTKDLKKICSEADILIVAIGKPLFIDSTYVKEKAVVIDVGTTYLDGKLVGDVNFNDIISKVDYATPVPGGVGPMTTTMLLTNLYEGV